MIVGSAALYAPDFAAYGTLVEYAKLLGMDEAVELLHATLEEEKETDEKLTELATTEVNLEAAQAADA